jgi:hypothetical protein
MRRVFIPILLAAVTCTAQEPFERVLQLARTRQKMAQVLTHLPDYTCVATTQRVALGYKEHSTRVVDTLRYEIAHFGGKELWAWPGEVRFQDTPLTSMVQNGTIATGDFALHARIVFIDGNANVKFGGEQGLEGRRALRWDFTIPVFASGWTIVSQGRSVVAGASGSFWADANTLDVLRLQIQTEDLPSNFPISSAQQVINYAQARIGSGDVLLPQTAVLTMELASGDRRSNLTEYSHCRRYSGEAEISFGAAPEAGATTLAPAPMKPAEVSLPPGLTVRMKLKSPIDSKAAVVGDALEATIVDDIGSHGDVLVPRGAVLTGRIRRLEKRDDGTQYFIVGIEFDDIDFPGHHARFFGALKSANAEAVEIESFMGASRTTTVQQNSINESSAGSFHLADVPGVATFFVKSSSFRLREGTQMVWETR